VNLKYIKFKIEDGVGRIQFNRPEKLNAVNPDVLKELETAVELCEGNDKSVRRRRRHREYGKRRY